MRGIYAIGVLCLTWATALPAAMDCRELAASMARTAPTSPSAATARKTAKDLRGLRDDLGRGAPTAASADLQKALVKLDDIAQEAGLPPDAKRQVFTIKGREAIEKWARENHLQVPAGTSDRGRTYAIGAGDPGPNRRFMTGLVLATPFLAITSFLAIRYLPPPTNALGLLTTLLFTTGGMASLSLSALGAPAYNHQAVEAKTPTVRSQFNTLATGSEIPANGLLIGSSYGARTPPTDRPSWDYVLDNDGLEPRLHVILRTP